MGHISQVDGERPELRVVYQHEEQDQANQGSHQKQQPKEQALAGPHTVHTPVLLSVGHGHGAPGQHNFQAMLQILFRQVPAGHQISDAGLQNLAASK